MAVPAQVGLSGPKRLKVMVAVVVGLTRPARWAVSEMGWPTSALGVAGGVRAPGGGGGARGGSPAAPQGGGGGGGVGGPGEGGGPGGGGGGGGGGGETG